MSERMIVDMQSSILYVYDEFAVSEKYARVIEAIEIELANKGLQGDIFRYQTLGDMRKPLEERLRHSTIKQVVFVGSEKMLSFALEQSSRGHIFGFIPLFSSHFTKSLGLPVGVEAVSVLAARVLVAFDVGLVNDQLFFEEVVLPEGRFRLTVKDAYTLEPVERGALSVRNLGLLREHGVDWADPFDGLLELVFQSPPPTASWLKKIFGAQPKETRLPFKEAQLELLDGGQVFADGQILSGTSFSFSVRPGVFRCIVGRGSRFLK